MFVSLDHRLAYLAPPRTGSTSLASVLTQAPFHAKFSGEASSPTVSQWHPELEGCRTLISVRHPYVRAVSLWRFTCLQAICLPKHHGHLSWRRTYADGLPNLEGFLRFPSLRPLFRSNWRCSWHLERIPAPVDHVLHLERLAEDLAQVPGLAGLSLPTLNVGPPCNQPWHAFYDQHPACVELVQQLWEDDFDEFGYEYDFDACRQGRLLGEPAGC
jgi:hypothetical protein